MARVPSLFTPGTLISSGFVGSDPFLSLYRGMNRLFDDVLNSGPVPSGGQASRSGLLLAPQLDVTETDKEVRIRAELPGVSDNDIDVSLNDDVLTIRAEKKQEVKEEREGVHVSERVFGTFQRSLRVPFQVSPDQVQANFENGVLTVTLPKAQPQERNRRIQVQGRSGGQQGDVQQGNGQQGNGQRQDSDGQNRNGGTSTSS